MCTILVSDLYIAISYISHRKSVRLTIEELDTALMIILSTVIVVAAFYIGNEDDDVKNAERCDNE